MGESTGDTTPAAGDLEPAALGSARAPQQAARSRPSTDDGALLVLDELGHIVHASPPARSILGARSADLIGRWMGDLAAPEDRLRLARWLAEHSADGSLATGQAPPIAFGLVRRHGLRANAEARSLPLTDAPGSVGVVVDLVGAPEDVIQGTREQLLVLEQRVEHLARSNRELESLAGTAAHELKGPLASLAASVELLVRRAGPELDETSQELVGALLRGIGGMSDLVDGLVRCSLSGVGLQVELGDGDALVGEVVDAMESELEAVDAVVAVVAPIGKVAGDLAQLQSVFRNLLGNAIRYRSPDRPLRVWIDIDDGSVERTFTVRDNGSGLDPVDRERVFGMFERVDRATPGSGIGLATCKRVIEGHGGRIWVGDGVDGGVAVHFTLPAQHLIGG